MSDLLIPITVLLPLLGGVLIPVLPFKKLKLMHIYVEALVILTSIMVGVLLFTKMGINFELVRFTGNLTLSLRMDGLGSVFCAMIAVLWPLVTLYAFEYMRHEGKEKSFFMFFTMTYGVTLGIACSANLLTMYCFYEMLTLVTLPLVMHAGTREAVLASRKYLYYSLGGAAFAFIGLIFIISYGLSLKKKVLPERKKSNFAGVEGITVGVFLSVISLCYLSYLFSQLAYFFSAFSGFLPENYEFSVSDYARRGFFEMSVIAAMNFLIIFIVLILTKKRDGKLHAGIKALCTFIAVFTLLIISTALSKMVLYIKSLGMTELRVGTSGFMIALGIIFISLIVRIYISKVRVIRTALISFAVVLTLFGCFNINSVIGEYNYNAYKNGWTETIDTRALYYLGPEGIPYLIKLSEDKDMSFEAESMIYDALLYGNYEYRIVETGKGCSIERNENSIKGLGSYSYPFMRAEKMLNEFIENNGDFLSEQWKHRYSYDNEVYYTIR